MKNFTHTGKLIGCDSRTAPGWYREINLRETRIYWVDDRGIQWRKKDGYQAGGHRYPMRRLSLLSVMEK